jgi:hypothetical protein
VGVLALIASCTYGTYDGKSGSTADGGVAGATSQSIAPGSAVTLMSGDAVFQVQVPAGTFTEPTTMYIEPEPNRTVNGITLPAFRVRVDPARPLQKPVTAVFFQNGNGGGGGEAYQVGLEAKPMPIGGRVANAYWGMTTTLGVITILRESEQQLDSFIGPQSTGCVIDCCRNFPNAPGPGGNTPLRRAGGSCQCAAGGGGVLNGQTIETACFEKCDLQKEATFCQSLNGSFGQQFSCTATSCGSSQKCCVTTSGAVCMAECTTPRARVCTSRSDCADTECTQAGRCAILTCGDRPGGCE